MDKIIITSTPKGNNFFYDEWIKFKIREERKEKLKKLMSNIDGNDKS